MSASPVLGCFKLKRKNKNKTEKKNLFLKPDTFFFFRSLRHQVMDNRINVVLCKSVSNSHLMQFVSFILSYYSSFEHRFDASASAGAAAAAAAIAVIIILCNR